jgi:[ribosomal protein S5]-alanine N-acetyltransferase
LTFEYRQDLLNLSSSRLKYRKLNENDVDLWMEFFQSDKALEFLPYENNNRVQCKAWLDKQINVRYTVDELGLYAVVEKDSSSLIGQCGLLWQEVDGVKELEIGYHLIPRFWRKGYATEATQTFKNFAFKNKLADSLISVIHINNFNSQKVAERNGMSREKETIFWNMPVFVYRIKKEEWLNIN